MSDIKMSHFHDFALYLFHQLAILLKILFLTVCEDIVLSFKTFEVFFPKFEPTICKPQKSLRRCINTI